MRTRITSFLSDTSGAIILLFALLFPVLVMSAGAAIDYSDATTKKNAAQASLDSGVLAGVAAAQQALIAGKSTSLAIEAAKAAAAAALAKSTAAGASVSFSIADGRISGTGRLSISSKTTILSMIGVQSLNLSVAAAAEGGVPSFMNVYLLVDVSASMLLPSTSAGIDAMTAATGCALACHDSSTGNDTYTYALNRNITLRYQVVQQGVTNLVNYIDGSRLYRNKVKLGLWSFDHELIQQAGLTTNYKSVSSRFPAPSLATSEEAAATPFDSYISKFITTVGKGGNGLTASAPRKLVILATDGVNDPTRAWTWNTSLRSQVRVFDSNFCSTLEKNGVTLAVIHTPYYPMTWDWGYNATLGQPGTFGGATRLDDIPIVLKRCAGSNYIEAFDQASIQSAFTTLFQRAQPVRLTQ